MHPDSFLAQRLGKDSKVLRNLESFSRSTGIPVRVINRGGREVWQSRPFKSKGGFCRLFAQKYKSSVCRISHQKAAQESIRWGVPTIGNCCSSILQITAPLMDSNRLAGYLLANPFMMTNPVEPNSEEVASFLKNPSRADKKFYHALSAIPVVKEEEVNQAAQRLFQLANDLSHPDLSCLAKVREIQDLQGKVAEEILSVKATNPDLTLSKFFKLSFDTEKEIIQKICSGEREKAKEILNKLLAILLYQYLSDIDLLKISILELVVFISRAAVEAGAKVEDILGLKSQCIAELWRVENQEELCLWSVKVVEDIIENIYRSGTTHLDPRLKRAIEFIDQHYGSDLGLVRVAREAFLSPSRFSHLFKSEMGLPFIEYLTKVRMQKARAILKNSEKSIAQVALEVGYQDQSYFTKVFKKSEGMSPKSFSKNFLNFFTACPSAGWK